MANKGLRNPPPRISLALSPDHFDYTLGYRLSILGTTQTRNLSIAYLGQRLWLLHVDAGDLDVVGQQRVGAVDSVVVVGEDQRRIINDLVDRRHILAKKLPGQAVEVHACRKARVDHRNDGGWVRVADPGHRPSKATRRTHRDERRSELPGEADAAVGAEDLRDDEVVARLTQHVLHLLQRERDLAVHATHVGDGVEVARRLLQLGAHELEGQRVSGRTAHLRDVHVVQIRHRLLLRQRRDRGHVMSTSCQRLQQRLDRTVMTVATDREEGQDAGAVHGDGQSQQQPPESRLRVHFAGCEYELRKRKLVNLQKMSTKPNHYYM
ncbi:hypothetical protein ACFE04_026799 [Oxalis oulophora]